MTSKLFIFLLIILSSLTTIVIYQEIYGETPELGTLCIEYSEGEDCSYTWEVLTFYEFEKIMILYEVVNPPYQLVEGITIASEKTIIARGGGDTADVLGHESRHVVCNIEFQKMHGEFEILKNCHDTVDLEYTAQSTRKSMVTPEPPLITEKLTRSIQLGFS